jgi:hypothetical protein
MSNLYVLRRDRQHKNIHTASSSWYSLPLAECHSEHFYIARAKWMPIAKDRNIMRVHGAFLDCSSQTQVTQQLAMLTDPTSTCQLSLSCFKIVHKICL